MAILPVEAVPMHQAKRVHPTGAVPPCFRTLARPMQQVVAERQVVGSTLRPVVVERSSACPTGRVVEEQAFGYPTQQVVAERQVVHPTLRPVVEQEFVPSQEFVVEERQVVHPTLLVVAEHPMHWVVDLVGSKNLHLAYFPAGSIPEV